MTDTHHRIHATAVSIDNMGVIIIGPSGSGKSDLALRLIDRGAHLIADDQIILTGPVNDPIISHCEHHKNAIEIRGIGIITMPTLNNIRLKLAISLSAEYERSPAPLPIINYGQYKIATLKINPTEISAPIKIEQALRNLGTISNIA